MNFLERRCLFQIDVGFVNSLFFRDWFDVGLYFFTRYIFYLVEIRYWDAVLTDSFVIIIKVTNFLSYKKICGKGMFVFYGDF